MLQYNPLINDLMNVASSLAVVGAIVWAAHVLHSYRYQVLENNLQLWQHEDRRRQLLSDADWTFRSFAKLISEFQTSAWLMRLGNINSVGRSLGRGGDVLPWKPAEYLSTKLVEAIIGGVFVWLALSIEFSFSVACFLGLAFTCIHYQRAAGALEKKAALRMNQLKQRLPYAIDLLALMLEAGGDLHQSLAHVAKENAGHPVGQEFTQIANAYAAGQTLRDTMDDLQERLKDDDISEIAFSIKNADELGVPLGKTFLRLAEQMRLKQIQWTEKIIGERKTMMSMPGLVIMIACMGIAVSPFLLHAFYQSN